MNKEVARLALYQNVLTTTPSAIGYRDSNSTFFSWNVNMQQLLGETLFNKYKAYKVQYCQWNRINNIVYAYLGGINIIQTSQNGEQQGNLAIVGAVTQPYATLAEQTWDCFSGLCQFVMIKPDNNNIQLTFSFQPMGGVAQTTSNYGAHFFTFYGLDEYNPLYKNPSNRFFNCPHRNFSLTTTILSAGTTNEYGTMSASRNNFTFNNVNIRNIIGPMWDVYDKFNLIMTTWGMGIEANSSFSGDQRNIYFSLEGLQWINNLAVGFNSEIYNNRLAFMGFGNIESASGTADSASGNCCEICSSTNTFRKPESENVNLSFVVSNVVAYNATGTYGNWNLNFIIVPVEK